MRLTEFRALGIGDMKALGLGLFSFRDLVALKRVSSMPRAYQWEWQVKKTGKFVLPGLFMIKTRKKAATKGGVRSMFGKEVKVKAQPAKTVVPRFSLSCCVNRCGFELGCGCNREKDLSQSCNV